MDKVQRIIASIDRISFTFIALKLLAIWGSLLSYGGYSLQFAKFKNFIYDFSCLLSIGLVTFLSLY
ncbi:MAG: hypothetical protein QW616_01490 [Thermoplasmata archaeon]